MYDHLSAKNLNANLKIAFSTPKLRRKNYRGQPAITVAESMGGMGNSGWWRAVLQSADQTYVLGMDGDGLRRAQGG